MKQSKGLNSYLKSEHKKTANRTKMGPTTDIDTRHRPSEVDLGGNRHVVKTDPPSYH